MKKFIAMVIVITVAVCIYFAMALKSAQKTAAFSSELTAPILKSSNY